MGLYADALADIIRQERDDNGATREDFEQALSLVFRDENPEPPIPRTLSEAGQRFGVSVHWDALVNGMEPGTSAIVMNGGMGEVHTNDQDTIRDLIRFLRAGGKDVYIKAGYR